MPRGYVWARYVDDNGNVFAKRVDADQVQDLNRGWDTTNIGGLAPFPRGWLPRVVIGRDPLGFARRAVVGTNVCALWDGSVTSFWIEATDQTLVECVVTGRLSEKTPHPG